MSHSDAKMFRDTVRQIVQDEIARVSPASRYAQVVRFVPGERRVIVHYNGEPSDNEVSLPYNTAAPSYVGQWVRVGGPASDRHIVDLLGESEPERRIAEMGRDAYVPPKWEVMDLRLMDTFPMTTFLEDGQTRRLQPDEVYGTMIRAPWDMSVSQMMVYVAAVHGTGNATLTLLLYSVDEGFNMTRIASAPFTRRDQPAEYRRPLNEGRVEVRRGQQVVAAIHSESTLETSIPHVYTRPMRMLDMSSGDFLSFSLSNQSSPPSYIARSSIPSSQIYLDQMIHLSLLDVRGED